ncbi:MAG TPA: hypothetical protein VG711_11245 [Phycisphaerales bacterium]|nr:hypothetical protein [Phycisphaerales bacterium]
MSANNEPRSPLNDSASGSVDAEVAAEARSLLTPRKVILQLVGWTLGIVLLVWIIKGAAQKGDWSRLRDASPSLVMALLACTVASALFNGTTFFATIQSIRKVSWMDMQLLNVTANALNYAPVRLGAVMRILYSIRIDRLTLLQIGAWFAIIGYLLFLGIGACILASLARSTVDVWWLLLVLGQMVVGVLAAQFFGSFPIVAKYGRGIDKMLADSRGVWIAAALRVLDLAAYTGRMAVALAILDIHIPPTHIVILAVVALASSLTPLGRVGVREFCVAMAAQRLSVHSEINFDQLALVESAGEALVYIPTGLVALFWLRKKWKTSRSIN